MKYRADIDGLRAVAVLAVFAYHLDVKVAGRDLLPGGFLGVDIFFVISGYLMANIILGGLAAGDFTFRDFYERRARRILPALFFVMLASLPFAWWLMLPVAYTAYAWSIVSSVLFGSNILFWTEGGYAGGASALKPFLHTWSLSVEEQFYLLFPVVAALTWKYAPRMIQPLLWIGLAMSLALAQWASHAASVPGFYLLPTRGWELLCGAVVAYRELHGRRLTLGRLAPFVSVLSLMVIAGFTVWLNDAMPHPSLWTVPPVLATMAIIHVGGGRDPGTRLLSLRPVVFVGLISYSLYLWHQPLLAFARIYKVGELSLSENAAIVAIAFVLAILSWKWIERPFRDRTRLSARSLSIMLGAAAALLVTLSAFVILKNGLPARFDVPIFADLDRQQKDLLIARDGKNCHERVVAEACTLGDMDATDRWIIVGDSHMGYLSTVLWKGLQKRGASLTILTRGGCPYAPGLALGSGETDHPCNPSVNEQRRKYLLDAPPSTVVIGGRLPYYLSGHGFDNGEGGVEMIQGKFTYRLRSPEGEAVSGVIVKDLEELLEAGHRLVIVYPTPEMGWDPSSRLQKAHMTKAEPDFQAWLRNGGVSISSALFKNRAAPAYAIYDRLPKDRNVTRIYPAVYFCDKQVKDRCISHDEDTMFYADGDHLSTAGNEKIVDDIIKQVQPDAVKLEK